MNHAKTGQQIRTLRTQLHMTQKQLAGILGVTDQAVSKWERGLGCPDVSLLPVLARYLGVSIEQLITEQPPVSRHQGGSMHALRFFVCPNCGNRLTASCTGSITCCGKELEALTPQNPDERHALQLEPVEDEWFITTGHPMEKEHYISFAAFVRGDQLLLTERWPEWDFQLRIPNRGHGFLYWYCTRHGLFRQKI